MDGARQTVKIHTLMEESELSSSSRGTGSQGREAGQRTAPLPR